MTSIDRARQEIEKLKSKLRQPFPPAQRLETVIKLRQAEAWRNRIIQY